MLVCKRMSFVECLYISKENPPKDHLMLLFTTSSCFLLNREEACMLKDNANLQKFKKFDFQKTFICKTNPNKFAIAENNVNEMI